MKLFFPSSPDLIEFVRGYFLLNMEFDDLNIPCNFPTGNSIMLIYLSKNYPELNYDNARYYQRSFICGILSKPVLIQKQSNFDCLMVFFTPLGAYYLFKIPQVYYQNSFIPLDYIFGSKISDIEEKLFLETNSVERIKVIENFLRKQMAGTIKRETYLEEAVSMIQKEHCKCKLSELRQILGVNKRSFERKFKTIIGINPKNYIKLERLKHIYQTIITYPNYDIHDLVYHCGYYDQSHLIHDLENYAHITPKKLTSKYTKYIQPYFKCSKISKGQLSKSYPL